jgi:adenylate cyclase
MLPHRWLPQPIRYLLWFVLIGAIVGAVYGHMSAVSDGAAAGTAVPAASRHKDGLLSRYCVIVLAGLAIGAALFPASAELGVGLPIRHQDVLFAFAVVLAIRLIDDINHLLGQNVLLNFITGRYHRPRLEQRVFLFIDIEGSTARDERLEFGAEGVHAR